jgi:hypothetical protein
MRLDRGTDTYFFFAVAGMLVGLMLWTLSVTLVHDASFAIPKWLVATASSIYLGLVMCLGWQANACEARLRNSAGRTRPTAPAATASVSLI